MRTRLTWPILVMTLLAVAACGDTADDAPSAATAHEATTSCASKGDLTMWERSGGNKDMVDLLVAAWNTKNPDCKINLTYIPHTEMVGKIAQGIASGDVPDLMGMDLIYAPQQFSPEALTAILGVARKFPRVRIVMDHVGWSRIEGPPGYGIGDQPAGLVTQPNVHFKFTTGNFNVMQEAKVPLQAFMRRLVDRIGADRLLWGSNMGSSAGTYEEMAARARDAVATLTGAEQRQVLCDTGRSVFMSHRKTK